MVMTYSHLAMVQRLVESPAPVAPFVPNIRSHVNWEGNLIDLVAAYPMKHHIRNGAMVG